MTGSVRLAVDGASSASGRPPSWLERASDIRFVDYVADGEDTLVVLELPTLGEAAEDLYRQVQMWDTRPAPEQTAVEVFSRVIDEVASESGESEWFDAGLLRRVKTLQRLFTTELHSVQLSKAPRGTAITQSVVESAGRLASITPPTRHVRVAGKLDMIRHSTRTFGLTMDSGEEVHGFLKSEGSIQSLGGLLGRRVLVVGQAVYRPSGRVLRIDTLAVEAGEDAPALWSKVPPPQGKRPSLVRNRPGETARHGVAAFFGTWPGEETEVELASAVVRLRA